MEFYDVSMAFLNKNLAKFGSIAYKTLAGNIVVFRKISVAEEN